jgi:hypothetical protein
MCRYAALAALALLLAATPALAEDADSESVGLWLSSGFVSRHSGDHDYNESNEGIGVELAFNRNWRLAAGVYDNSVRETSHYAQVVWSPDASSWRGGDWKASLGIAVGLVDGYPDMRDGGVFPTLLPVATVEWRRLGANLTYIPSVAGNVSGAMALQVKFRFY